MPFLLTVCGKGVSPHYGSCYCNNNTGPKFDLNHQVFFPLPFHCELSVVQPDADRNKQAQRVCLSVCVFLFICLFFLPFLPVCPSAYFSALSFSRSVSVIFWSVSLSFFLSLPVYLSVCSSFLICLYLSLCLTDHLHPCVSVCPSDTHTHKSLMFGFTSSLNIVCVAP